ncbi:VWA domain-containing protein [Desulfobulbus sp.]|uniref:VWA domain-containing protein n=1 Tax=Desulfobulbus sp. TaxID=895 RepID=UPI00286EC6B3|nr:VWA domain-containing protein [Desulfobulbus sp.]
MRQKEVFQTITAWLCVWCLLVCSAVVDRARAAELTVESRSSVAAVAPGAPVAIKVLVEIAAPEIPPQVKRQPLAISLVIDHSGSMFSAKKMEYAIQAGKVLVRALEPQDELGLIIYDDKVTTLYPLGKVPDKEKLYKLLDTITPDGSTFLSGGLEAGVGQLKERRFEGVSRVILLSDGLANQGVTGAVQVGQLAAKARKQGVNISTIGLGADYDEDLMQAVAQQGGGQYYYVNDVENLPAVFRQEAHLAAAMYSKDLTVALVPAAGTKQFKARGYTQEQRDGALNIDMSNLSSGEKRQVLLEMEFTPVKGEAQQKLGVLKFNYKTEDGRNQSQETPLTIDVLEDAKAVADVNAKAAPAIRQVEEESLLMDASEAHVAAIEKLKSGDAKGAKKILEENQKKLAPVAPGNKAIASKMEQLAVDEKQLERAAGNVSMQKEMSKSSKSSVYMSAQGKKEGIMLRKGDSGYRVEALQKALKAKGLYTGPQDGVFSEAVETAVKASQKANGLAEDGVAGPSVLKQLGL